MSKALSNDLCRGEGGGIFCLHFRNSPDTGCKLSPKACNRVIRFFLPPLKEHPYLTKRLEALLIKLKPYRAFIKMLQTYRPFVIIERIYLPPPQHELLWWGERKGLFVTNKNWGGGGVLNQGSGLELRPLYLSFKAQSLWKIEPSQTHKNIQDRFLVLFVPVWPFLFIAYFVTLCWKYKHFDFWECIIQ